MEPHRPHAWTHGASGFPCSRGTGKRGRPRWFENHVRHPTRCRPLLIATSATSGIAAGAYDGECLPVRAIRVPLGRREYTCVGIEARLSLAIVRRVGAVSAEEVDEYLRGFDEPKRSALQTLRRTILEIVPEAEQVISYRVPAFRVSGQIVAGFAAFKDHLSYLPFSGSVLGQLADELKGYTMTKSSLHFPVDRPLPKGLVKKLIKVRLAQIDQRSRS